MSTSAAPTRTGESNQPSTSTNAGGKKRRLNDGDNGGDRDDNENDLDDDDDDPEFDSSNGELTFEDIEMHRKKKAALRKAQTDKRKRQAMLAGAADAPNTPSAATQLCQAIYEYVRMLMGMPRKSRGSETSADPTLPPPPSDAEMKAWLGLQEEREKKVQKAVDRAIARYMKDKPEGFKPNRSQTRAVEKDAADCARSDILPINFSSRINLVSSSRYAHNWGTQCEAALALAGFPRCTLDWGAGYDSPWNASMSSIILQQWLKCFNSKGARAFMIAASDNTELNRNETLRRWFINKKAAYRDQMKTEILLETAEGQAKVKADKEYSKKLKNCRTGKSKIQRARVDLAKEIFGANSPESKLLSHQEVHSEDDMTSSVTCKVRLNWRSAQLDSFIFLVDQSIVGSEISTAGKKKKKLLIERGPYSTTPDVDRFPPKNFQRSLVSPTWIGTQASVAIKHLRLKAEDAVQIENSIVRLTDELAATPATSQ